MKALQHILTAIMTLTLVSCAFDKNTNTDNQREIEDNAELAEKYARVTGLYRGTVSTSQGLQQVELNFFPFSKKIGENSNGEDKVKLELRARYRRLDTVTNDVTLTVRFYEETAQLLMSNSDQSGALVLNINANLRSDVITGNVNQNTQPLGRLEVRLVSREYSNQDPNEQTERNNRLRKLYDTIVGDYTGVVRLKGEDPFAVTLRVYHTNVDIEGVTTTVLKAYYRRNSDIDRTLKLNMNADYRPDTNPPSITLKSVSTGDYKVTIEGTLENGSLHGTFTNENDGLKGPVTLTKQH